MKPADPHVEVPKLVETFGALRTIKQIIQHLKDASEYKNNISLLQEECEELVIYIEVSEKYIAELEDEIERLTETEDQ